MKGLIFYLKKYSFIVFAVVLLGALFLVWSMQRNFDDITSFQLPDYSYIEQQSILAAQDTRSRLEPSYLAYYNEYQNQGAVDTVGFETEVKGMGVRRSSSGVATQDVLDGVEDVLILLEEDSWVEYEFEVPSDGFYQLGMMYYAVEGNRSSLLRSIQINEEHPFYQSKRLEFKRMWTEDGEPWRDSRGDQYNPRPLEVFGWQYQELRDADGKVGEPYRFYLKAGKHTLRLTVIREPGAIGSIRIFSPTQYMTYKEKLEQYRELDYKETKGHFIKVQAENADLKSDPTLRRSEDREPASEPFDRVVSTLNVIGGATWRTGGQWLEWEFEVPENGLYHIGARYGSWFVHGMPVQRIVTINDQIPFREMNYATFDYDPRHQVSGLGGENYLHYLEEGSNRIRMEVQIGELGEVFEKIQNVSYKMSMLSREVILITGTNPDRNRDWNLVRYIPNIVPRLHLMIKDLQDAIELLYDMGLKTNSQQLSVLQIAGHQLLSMAEDVDTIPARVKQLNDTQASLSDWINSLSQQSLLLDYFVIKSPDMEWPAPSAGVLKQIFYSINDFALSFVKDYQGVGETFNDEKTIDVWVARGRDWVKIIKQMADEDFTSNTGIKVNVNTIPVGASNLLMLATTSGKEPDVAIGLDNTVPIDFAIRNALVNLNQFPDYPEVAQRFRPGALIPYRYNGNDYALPETQNFSMLFYRIDILEELGIDQIPQTWDEVLALIPILQQNGMDFFYEAGLQNAPLATASFTPFLFQNGGELYRNEGMESALDSAEALKAVRDWTELYSNYRIARQANFYNRFRTGEMPIGVADYTTYILLSTAAPELMGWWKMVPMPGIRQDDGSINRSTGGTAETAMIFRNTELKQESWEFVKWWTSADVQELFAKELEAIMGVEARWNTSNVEAITRLPWPREDIESILTQWDWFKEREIVLGSYYTDRHILNLWNAIVLQGITPVEALDEATKEINKELMKKRIEYGLQ